MNDTCPLCGFPTDPDGPRYTEGIFCTDTAGCRRRALALIERHTRDLAATKQELAAYRQAELVRVRDTTGL